LQPLLRPRSLRRASIANYRAAYVRGLDCGPEDMHGFVANGLVYPADDDSPLEPEKILTFYERPEWVSALRAFANLNESDSQVRARCGVLLRDLAGVVGGQRAAG
jgi:hypothetical protein